MPPNQRTHPPDPADAVIASRSRSSRSQPARASLLNRPPAMQAGGEAGDPELSAAALLAGRQCHRRLWWSIHDAEPSPVEPDLAGATQTWRREQVLALARLRWSSEGPGEAASFTHQGLRVVVDHLGPNASGVTLGIVDVATQVREATLVEAAAQTWAARGCGVPVTRVELVHLDRASRALDDRLTCVDITAEVEALQGEVAAQLDLQRRALRGSLPEAPVGDHCAGPQPCPFIARCWPRVPAGHVGELYHAAPEQTAALEARGYRAIAALPDGVADGAVQRRQILAAQHRALVVEPGLAAAMAELRGPLRFLDFETIMPALPPWPGCRPYEAVAVQFSVHRLAEGGELVHHAHLAEPGGDPRPALARALVEALEPSAGEPILAWHAPFERGCLLDLAEAVPDRAVPLRALADRLVDLLPLVRDHVYHPGFAGSFGLKRVMAALLPQLADPGAAIDDGWTASLTLERLLLDPDHLTADAREQVRAQLLGYCRRDTLALVELVALLTRLGQMAVASRPVHLIPLGSDLAARLRGESSRRGGPAESS